MTSMNEKSQPRPTDEDAWFYTLEWQAGEAEADRDLAEGRVVGPFDNIEDALKALKTTKSNEP